MKNHYVLIPGGYGAVGSIIAELLSIKENLTPVIAGRREDQAKKLAKKLGCLWTTIDLENRESIQKALKDIDIVISCYIPSDEFNILLPEMAAEQGIHYLDVAAFNSFNQKVMGLHKKAAANRAVLITALGLFPGVPGLIIGSNRDYFDNVDCVDIFFTSGGNMDNLSPLALQGIGHMMKIPPLKWENGKWVKPSGKARKEHIAKPFNKEIGFYPDMVTFDLIKIPEIMKINQINMWSMSESLFLGMILLLGLKLGFAKTVKRAAGFLRLLRLLGRSKNEDYSMKIVSRGTKDNKALKRTVEMNATEEYLTAIIPAIICEQIINGDINQVGAYTGAEVVDSQKLIKSLKLAGINHRDEMEMLHSNPVI